MIDVPAIDMPIARPTEIADVQLVWLKNAVGVWADEKAVLIVMRVRIVMVVMHAELRRVARPDEILAIVVRDENSLPAILEGVQIAVGVFFQFVEIDDVELIAIGQARAEQADAAVYIVKD